MVDCRPAAGAPPNEMHAAQPHNGASHDNHQAAGSGAGDMANHPVTSPGSVRASTPAATNTLATYTGGTNQCGSVPCPMGAPPLPPMPGMPFMPVQGVPGVPAVPGMPGVPGYACAPFCKQLMWYPPQSHLPPPPPPGVNVNAVRSHQANGSDLPMNGSEYDLVTIRYYFNLGLECMWAAYGSPPQFPPRHYTTRDLAQDMQQVSIQDRPVMNQPGEPNYRYKTPPNDKNSLNNQGKGNGQRPLVGPRFKRGGNHPEGGNMNNYNPNKGHNNNMGNKGSNNRRNSHNDNRNPPPLYGPAEGECVMEQPLLTFPYCQYPPPVYPVPYYPMEDPSMMGMMGGMGYVGYDEGVEYGPPVQHYYAAPHYPPPNHHQHHADHK